MASQQKEGLIQQAMASPMISHGSAFEFKKTTTTNNP
jgi:hypothetical protein